MAQSGSNQETPKMKCVSCKYHKSWSVHLRSASCTVVCVQSKCSPNAVHKPVHKQAYKDDVSEVSPNITPKEVPVGKTHFSRFGVCSVHCSGGHKTSRASVFHKATPPTFSQGNKLGRTTNGRYVF
jgi:hypothetical protein